MLPSWWILYHSIQGFLKKSILTYEACSFNLEESTWFYFSVKLEQMIWPIRAGLTHIGFAAFLGNPNDWGLGFTCESGEKYLKKPHKNLSWKVLKIIQVSVYSMIHKDKSIGLCIKYTIVHKKRIKSSIMLYRTPFTLSRKSPSLYF